MAEQPQLREPMDFGSDAAGLIDWLHHRADSIRSQARSPIGPLKNRLRYNEWADAVRRLMDAEAP